MSRVGKVPISIPSGVTVSLTDGNVVVKGAKGEESIALMSDMSVSIDDGAVTITPVKSDSSAYPRWGLFRSLVNNMVIGVSTGFSKDLELNGVGYKVALDGNQLRLALGYSHDVMYDIPAGITITCANNTSINVSGANKQRVGQTAAEIRSYRPPEPYKGKGVKYKEEVIRKKVGKKK